MKEAKAETTQEQRMVMGIETSFSLPKTGWIGNQILSEIAKMRCPEVFPLDVKIYGMQNFISKNVIPFDPNAGISGYDFTMSGSFTYPTGDRPCSILINNGKTVCGNSAHAHLGFPDSVIYEYFDGTVGYCRVVYDTEIPNRKNVKWAIGGAGLGADYNPKAEGYYRIDAKHDFSDVWRDTDHILFGVKNGYKHGVYVEDMDATEMQAYCARMRFEHVLKLDGGHVPASNSPNDPLDKTPDINTKLRQGYAIQFVR